MPESGRDYRKKHEAMLSRQFVHSTDNMAKVASSSSADVVTKESTDFPAFNAVQLNLLPGAIFKGRLNQKMCIVSNGSVNLPEPARAPYAASVYQGDGTERRVNLDIVLSEANELIIRRLDTEILRIAKERSIEWFGKDLSEEAIASRYMPMCKLRAGELCRLRTKLNLDSIVVWGHDKTLQAVPENKFAGMLIKCALRITSIWFMSNNFGCTVQLTQVGLVEEDEFTLTCPF